MIGTDQNRSSSTDVAAAGSQEALEAFMHFSRKFTDERFMVINLKVRFLQLHVWWLTAVNDVLEQRTPTPFR